MTRRGHLGELEAMVLAAVLHSQPATGPDVYDELAARTGRDPSLPGIHVTLRRLRDKGYVTAESVEAGPRGGRPSTRYRLSPAGAFAMARMIVFPGARAERAREPAMPEQVQTVTEPSEHNERYLPAPAQSVAGGGSRCTRGS